LIQEVQNINNQDLKDKEYDENSDLKTNNELIEEVTKDEVEDED